MKQTRRILGVLLRQLDGFEGKRSIVIGATNRKQDLDAALRSRFDTSIYFQLPNPACRSGAHLEKTVALPYIAERSKSKIRMVCYEGLQAQLNLRTLAKNS